MPDEQEQGSLDLIHSKQKEISEQADRLRSKARRQKLIYNWLGYSTIAISIALGGSLGSTLLGNGGLLADSFLWTLIGAILGFVSAFFAAIQTRGRLAEQAQANLRLAADYDDLHRTEQRYLASYAQDPNQVHPPSVHVEWVDKRLGDFQRQEAAIDTGLTAEGNAPL